MNDSAPLTDDERWERRFNKLKEVSPEEPRPFFYTRLQARLAQRPDTGWTPVWLRRPAYALSAFGLIVLLNAGALFYYSDSAPTTTDDVTTYDGFVADYLPTNSIDYVNE
ncbi:hypothetical protein [Spirosoma sp. KUDC1026]|uniref:hypothetical protein n=1 Tax=Spirosoma sp. KUDC1026 TaxID=2745947 RepID=UPI00159BA324|nr:hypothetical protein [Spirosoma sp. KUDC1026]QKZ13291.1 hypothetical protein HU175_11860 [Spirosoma sp. KUDC1026]